MIPQELINEYKLHNIGIKDIAKIVNKHQTTVFIELKKLGIETNYFKIKTKKRNEKIIEAYKKGMSQVCIGQKFNISKQRINQIIKRANYEIQNNQS